MARFSEEKSVTEKIQHYECQSQSYPLKKKEVYGLVLSMVRMLNAGTVFCKFHHLFFESISGSSVGLVHKRTKYEFSHTLQHPPHSNSRNHYYFFILKKTSILNFFFETTKPFDLSNSICLSVSAS